MPYGKKKQRKIIPHWQVTLAPELPLELLGGYGTLGGGEQEHGREPVPYRQVTAFDIQGRQVDYVCDKNDSSCRY